MDRAKLLEMLKAYFSESELRDICFELNVDYEDLAGEAKASKARELIGYLDRRRRLHELVIICQRLRPNEMWLSSDAELTNPKGESHSLEVQISYLSRRLNKLQEIVAVKGIDTEPHYLIEIEDLQEKLNELLEQRKNI